MPPHKKQVTVRFTVRAFGGLTVVMNKTVVLRVVMSHCYEDIYERFRRSRYSPDNKHIAGSYKMLVHTYQTTRRHSIEDLSSKDSLFVTHAKRTGIMLTL